MEFTEDHLSFLLRFIRGEEQFSLLGAGITTYSDRDENNQRIYESCLELEKRGLIERHHDENNIIVWKPKS
jgi:hypothetical protein